MLEMQICLWPPSAHLFISRACRALSGNEGKQLRSEKLLRRDLLTRLHKHTRIEDGWSTAL